VGGLAAALLAGSCSQILGIEELSPSDGGPGGFAVRGTATGVLGPVPLELRLGDDTELLAVTREGSFAFETRLEDGASYTVAIADASVPCMLRNQTGVISGADAGVELVCAVPSLASVVVSGIAPAIALVPGTSDYVVDLPLLQSSVTVTAAVASDGDTLAIAGALVASGAPSAEIALSLGDNPVDIVVENDLGWQYTYRLTLRRAGELAQYAYAKASNTGGFDALGVSVALAGDIFAVGAPGEDSAATGLDGNDDDAAENSGAVYVFRRTGAVWQQEAYLKASNTGAGDSFGAGVALEGDTLVVGASGEASAATGVNGNQADDSAPNSGAVYVFRRSGATWAQEAYLKASNTGADNYFGVHVALSGDTLAVGASGENGVGAAQASSGAAYVFVRSGATWQQQAYLKASNVDASDFFGTAVALSGDTLAVAATGEDSAAQGVGGAQADNSLTGSGAVYVFRRSGATWQQEAYVKASNTGAGDSFGASVALAGDVLAVGATGEGSAATGIDGDQADNSLRGPGAAYVFRRIGLGWQQEAYVKASNTGADDFFGWSVALSGDTLVVGSLSEFSAATGVNGDQTDDTTVAAGAVYVFRFTGAWRQDIYIKASNTGSFDRFGSSVALSGDTIVVGAYEEDSAATGIGGDQADDTALGSGAVYIFH
jgi:hypothetical protein